MSPPQLLVWFLRLTAIMFLCAAPAIVMPTAWMRTIGRWPGLDDMPESALMEYLTRSVSALYVMMGASYWFLSCDVRRYLPLLRFTVYATLVFNVTILILDVMIPMPILWTVGEAVATMAWTLALWWLVRRMEVYES
jgi:hypothetical protein